MYIMHMYRNSRTEILGFWQSRRPPYKRMHKESTFTFLSEACHAPLRRM